jgi:uncharacterized membrane protein YoaK (UPF0700 family)
MENQTSKSRRGRVFFGVIMGFAVGFIIGFITGVRTSSLQLVWITVGLVCFLIIVVGIYWYLRSGKKKE